ncbi:unnamed protein product [Vicia faba]|uniref:BED-type domain-containing protein n=1 Tax=Vicia faba TaxID=3906 RepID=A0AAV0ZRN3_VICFA|nr:unnamed protein product [Vicia faba]
MELQRVAHEIVDEVNVVDLIHENETIQGENESKSGDDVTPKSKKEKTSNADCWKVFTKIGKDKDGIPRVKCNGCSKILKGGDRNYGTTSLNRHMKKCTKIKYADVGQVMVDLDWLKYLNPDFSPISRNTVKADVEQLFKMEKETLKKELANIPSRISLTSDLWTTCTTEGYICLTSHYVDSNWNLKNNASANDMIESVKYVKGSDGRIKKFKERIELIGGVEISAGLSYDVSTRWNSTYLMLQSALKYQCVFGSLSFHDDISVVLALGAVLNPRIKLTSLEYMYEKVDPLTSNLKTEEIKQKLYTLFEMYRSLHTSSLTTSQTPSSNAIGESSSHAFTKGLFNDLKIHKQ